MAIVNIVAEEYKLEFEVTTSLIAKIAEFMTDLAGFTVLTGPYRSAELDPHVFLPLKGTINGQPLGYDEVLALCVYADGDFLVRLYIRDVLEAESEIVTFKYLNSLVGGN